jgi:hypothetical protein
MRIATSRSSVLALTVSVALLLGSAGAASALPSFESSSSTAPVAATQTTKNVTTKSVIKYSTKTVKTHKLAKGVKKTKVKGVNGVRTKVHLETWEDGRRVGVKLISNKVTKKPVTRVVWVGLGPVAQCDPNYSGCVPIASDVDCAGGSGNGPAYVEGPVTVIGRDIYGLDGDGD